MEKGARVSGGTSTAYTPNMRKPAKDSPISKRGVWALLLSILLPPVGILYIWKAGVFKARGRVLLTFLSTLIMAWFIFAIMPEPQLDMVAPIPVKTVSATKAPISDVVTALSNIEELLAAQDAAASPSATPAPVRDLTAEQAILETIVYSVRSGARFYHTSNICDGQTNRQPLTVAQAQAAGLAACAKCKPPVPPS